jgi:ribosome-binding protein aMBF1 (putative translation factor)
MAECYKCGVSDEHERLFDAISNKGVVKICRNCSDNEEFPLIQPVDLNKPEKTQSVYERLSAMAKLDPEKHRKMIVEREKEDALKRRRQLFGRDQATTLKDVIDTNFDKKRLQQRTDLIPNFHWVIMRTRRSKKLTQKQLAENIGESESLVKSAEEGVILNNADVFLRKLESYLGIKIRTGEGTYSTEDPAKKDALEKLEKEGNFDNKTTENLTIADLQEAKKKKEGEESGGFFSFLRRNRKKEEDTSENSEEEKDEAKSKEGKEENTLSDKEADEILFGKDK